MRISSASAWISSGLRSTLDIYHALPRFITKRAHCIIDAEVLLALGALPNPRSPRTPQILPYLQSMFLDAAPSAFTDHATTGLPAHAETRLSKILGQ
jgi:hypothetical protein